MKGSTFFHKRVRLPIWPIIPLLFIGYAITPRYHSQIDVIMGNYAAAGLVIVAVRYWWAWVHGAPWFDWIVLMVLCVTIGILSKEFVWLVARFV